MFRLFCIVALISLFSCQSNRKLIYLQGKFSEKPKEITLEKPEEYKLHPQDVLFIRVQSVNPSTSIIFNTETSYSSSQNATASFYISGYPIDEAGNVTLPVLGPIKAAGYTVKELQKGIETKLLTYYKNEKDYTVIVKLVSFKISILGEVNKPGYYYIYQEQVNVLEAIAMAGDLTAFGDRKHIKILRQSKSGIEVSYIDLRDPAVIQSPSFFLKPNDVIYIQPLRYKNARNNITLVSWLFAGVSTLILVLNFAKNN